MKKLLLAIAALAAGTMASNAAGVKITELMYTGLYGEFVEITNTDATSTSLTGWVYSDNHRDNGSGTHHVSLSAIGTLAAGKSAIITECDTAVFQTVWYGTYTGVTMPTGMVIVGNVTTNLGRSDEVNIYNSLGVLQDELTFNDQGTAGANATGPDTSDFSAVPGPLTVLGDNIFKNWQLSVIGVKGAWQSGNHAASGNGSVGSPGFYP
jgi:hypothetical protein